MESTDDNGELSLTGQLGSKLGSIADQVVVARLAVLGTDPGEVDDGLRGITAMLAGISRELFDLAVDCTCWTADKAEGAAS
jgi:hypothetical protein